MEKLIFGTLVLVLICHLAYSKANDCVPQNEFAKLQEEVVAFRQEFQEDRKYQENRNVELQGLVEKQKLELAELRALTEKQDREIIRQGEEIKLLKDTLRANQILDNKGPVTEGQNDPLSLHRKRYSLGDVYTNGGVAFSASLTQWNVGNLGQGQTIIFNKVISNLGNGYDRNVGVFKVPMKGWYVFSLTIMAVSGDKAQELEVVLNGSVLFHCYASGSEYNSASRTMVAHANRGDIVTVQTSNWQHSDKLHGNEHTSFTGFLLYEDIVG